MMAMTIWVMVINGVHEHVMTVMAMVMKLSLTLRQNGKSTKQRLMTSFVTVSSTSSKW